MNRNKDYQAQNRILFQNLWEPPQGTEVTQSNLRFASVISALFSLVACDGDGGFVPPSSSPPASGWQQGVFLDASTFQNMCAAPRTGADPTNNNQPYPDLAGTTTDEIISCGLSPMIRICGTTKLRIVTRPLSPIRRTILIN